MLANALVQIAILPTLLFLCIALGWCLAEPLAAGWQDRSQRLIFYWLIGIIAFSWIGTLLAALSLLHGWMALGVTIGVAGWARLKERRASRSAALAAAGQRTPPAAQLALLVLLVGAAWLFGRPAEGVFIRDDPSVYTLGGILLARTGSLLAEPHAFWQQWQVAVPGGLWGPQTISVDELITPSADFLRQFFFIEAVGIPVRHYGPFYQWTLSKQTLEIGFLPLPKVWTALVVWIFGPAHSSWAAPFFGISGLAALYALLRRALGWKAGLLAICALGISLPQVWFARLPASEIYGQALLLGGLYLMALARCAPPEGARRLAFWSALALAAITLLRIEAMILLAVLTPLLLLLWWRAEGSLGSVARIWLLCMAIASAVGLTIGLAVARYYLFTRSLSATPALARLALVGMLVCILAGYLLWRMWQHNAALLQRWTRQGLDWLPGILAVLWGLWIAWAMVMLASRDWGSSLAGWLAQYWTLAGMLLSSAGALWLLRQARAKAELIEVAALLGLATFFLLSYSISHFVTPIHPWAARRLVPVIMPAMAIGIGAFFQALLGEVWLPKMRPVVARAWRWVGMPLIGALLLGQIVLIGQRSYPILWHRERQGFWEQFEQFVQSLPDEAVLLFDSGPVSQGITQPLELLFGRPSAVIYDTMSDASDLKMADQVVEAALAQQRPVFFIATGAEGGWLPTRWELAGQGARWIDMPILAQTWGRLPGAEDILRQRLQLDIYQVLAPTRDGRALDLPWEIPLGPGSYPYLRQGFYGWDYVDDAVVRWTGGEALLTLPNPQREAGPFVACLQLDLAGGRPPDAEPGHLTVMLDGAVLFDDVLSKSYTPQRLSLPLSIASDKPNLEVVLRSSTFNAAPYSEGRDRRNLGVLLYAASLRPLEQCDP